MKQTAIQKSAVAPVFPITCIEHDGKYYQIQTEEKRGRRREYVEAEGKKLYLNKNREISARQPGVYAQTETLENFEDVNKILQYFLDHRKYNYYLLFTMGCTMARRIGDLLALKWNEFYHEDGTLRRYRRGTEQKTGKNSRIPISKSIIEALKLYTEMEKIDVSEEYDGPIFVIRHGQYSGNVLSYKAYWKALKKAERECKIECNIGAHTPRRVFGYMAKQLHPNDPLATNITMEFYGHSSERITNRYTGVTAKRKHQYSYDFDEAFRKYAIEGEKVPTVSKKPVVTIDMGDLREVVKLAYESGMNNKEKDAGRQLDEFNGIMEIIEGLIR